MKEIKLTQGKVTLIDDEYYELVSNFKWFFHTGYASSNKYENKKQKTIKMHRLIMSAPKGLMVDHINHDTLDNRKENLRILTNQQNVFNGKVKKHSSKYKGVSWHKSNKKWCARIGFNESVYLGLFDDENEAGKAYNENAIKYFGEFALLNEIEGEQNEGL